MKKILVNGKYQDYVEIPMSNFSRELLEKAYREIEENKKKATAEKKGA